MKKLAVLLAVASVLALGACDAATKDPTAQSDNVEASFKGSPKVPVDRNLYVLKGEVFGDVSSLTRQVDPGGGQIFGYGGYVSGSVNGARYAGKGYVRLKLVSIDPAAPFGTKAEDVVIIKTADTKAAALLPGDVVEFKCRAQYESVAPIQTNERFNKDTYASWEFDFCRLSTPDIGGK